MSPRASGGQLSSDHLVHHRYVDLNVEQVGGQVDLAVLALGIE
jgi:hypothetical protein